MLRHGDFRTYYRKPAEGERGKYLNTTSRMPAAMRTHPMNPNDGNK